MHGYTSTLFLLACVACLSLDLNPPKTKEEQCLFNFVHDNLNRTSAGKIGLTSYQSIREYYNLVVVKQQAKGYISLVDACTKTLPSVASLVASSSSHTLFAKAIQADKDIYALLNGADFSKTFTVFAPTDDAMSGASNSNTPVDLRYHIIRKRLLTEQANPDRTFKTQVVPPFLSKEILLEEMQQVTTLSRGQIVRLSASDSTLTLNGKLSLALKTWEDSKQRAWNGIVYSIDGYVCMYVCMHIYITCKLATFYHHQQQNM